MTVQLPHGLPDSPGATGLALIRALVAGERDPVRLARLRAPGGANRTEASTKALTGHDQPEQGVARQPALALDDADPEPGPEGEADIDWRLRASKPGRPPDRPPLNREHPHRPHHKHAPGDDARGLRDQRTGVDLVAIAGRHARTGPTGRSASGLDRRPWPHAQAFGSWLGCAPRHESSGGNVWRRRMRKTRSRAGPAVRLAAPALSRCPKGLGP